MLENANNENPRRIKRLAQTKPLASNLEQPMSIPKQNLPLLINSEANVIEKIQSISPQYLLLSNADDLSISSNDDENQLFQTLKSFEKDLISESMEVDESSAEELDSEDNGDIYCFCQNKDLDSNYIECDKAKKCLSYIKRLDNLKVEGGSWFHWTCVGITHFKGGSWFCERCKGSAKTNLSRGLSDLNMFVKEIPGDLTVCLKHWQTV